MPLLDQAAKWTTNKMPKVITPKAHAIIDYAVAASFFGMAAFFWRRNKRAAVSALVCGAAETITALCTDYPGGVVKEISYETHGAIDFGLSGLVASLPDMLRFADEPESRFFRMQGLGLATVTGLTDFTGTGEGGQLEELDRGRRKRAFSNRHSALQPNPLTAKDAKVAKCRRRECESSSFARFSSVPCGLCVLCGKPSCLNADG